MLSSLALDRSYEVYLTEEAKGKKKETIPRASEKSHVLVNKLDYQIERLLRVMILRVHEAVDPQPLSHVRGLCPWLRLTDGKG